MAMRSCWASGPRRRRASPRTRPRREPWWPLPGCTARPRSTGWRVRPAWSALRVTPAWPWPAAFRRWSTAGPESASSVLDHRADGHQELDHDEQDDHHLEGQRSRGVDLALQPTVDVAEDLLLAGDRLLPCGDAQLLHRGLVDPRQIEVADDLERVLDALDQLAHLQQGHQHLPGQRGVGTPEDGAEALPFELQPLVHPAQAVVERLVIVAELEKLSVGDLQDVGDVLRPGRLVDEGGIPVDDHQVVVA